MNSTESLVTMGEEDHLVVGTHDTDRALAHLMREGEHIDNPHLTTEEPARVWVHRVDSTGEPVYWLAREWRADQEPACWWPAP